MPHGAGQVQYVGQAVAVPHDLRDMRPLLRWARKVHDELEEQVRSEFCGREVPPYLWGLRPGSHTDAPSHRRLSCVLAAEKMGGPQFDNTEGNVPCRPCQGSHRCPSRNAEEAPAATPIAESSQKVAVVAVQVLFSSAKPGRRTTASSASLPGETRSPVVSNLIRSIISIDRRGFCFVF